MEDVLRMWVGEGKAGDRILFEDIFFFFKQKTAYEIKECDWSSDVCSSDLLFQENYRAFIFIKDVIHHLSCPALVTFGHGVGDLDLDLKPHIARSFFHHWQIGRASCRERV